MCAPVTPPPSLLSVQTALKFALRNNHDKHLGGLPIKNEHFVIYRHGETFFPPFLSDSRWFSVLVLPFFSASYFLFPLPLFFLSFLLPLFSLSSFSLLFSLLFPKGAQICRQDLRYADGNADLPTVSFLWSFFLSLLLPLFPLIFLHFF